MFSKELLLDAGDFEVFGWSSRSSAETENASDFLDCEIKGRNMCWIYWQSWQFLTCWMSVSGDMVILGGGGESTSSSDDDEFDRERLWLLDLDLDRDFVRDTLKFDGESHVINDFAW